MSGHYRLLATLAAPLKFFDVRSRVIEKMLGLPLSREDVRLIRGPAGKTRLGAYYHWYLQKLIVARSIKSLDRVEAMRMVRSIDHTDYEGMQQIIDHAGGVLIAIPHHAHYVLSMTALAERLGRHRKVNVFYAHPSTRKGNVVFDRLHEVLFADPSSGVEVIHDNRQGLAKAMKGLKDGEVVLIMPDAFAVEDSTMMIPFCGRLMGTMLGTAVLARKTGSRVWPVLSQVHGRGLGFKTWFGEPFDHPEAQVQRLNGEQLRLADYGLMRRLFVQLEARMEKEIHLWQNVRGHLSNSSTTALADPDALASLADSLADSPLFKAPRVVVDLR